MAEKRIEARDGLNMPVRYVTQRKNRLNISRQMPQICNYRIPIIEERWDGPK